MSCADVDCGGIYVGISVGRSIGIVPIVPAIVDVGRKDDFGVSLLQRTDDLRASTDPWL